MPSRQPTLEGPALRSAIRRVLAAFLDLERYDVFIFGSEADGTGTSRSDVDIGILGPEPVSGATIAAIREELARLRTLRAFDVVDFSRAAPAFRTTAMRHAERI